MIFDKMNYLNKNIPCLISVNIYEFDMKSGGFSILKKNNIFSESELKYINTLSKLDRNIYIGKLILKRPELNDLLADGFKDAIMKFSQYNNIAEHNVISIKKDAIFIFDVLPRVLSFDGYTFQRKNTYSSYYYLNKLEIYYSSKSNLIDIKGISDANLIKHRNGILTFMLDLFRLAERKDKKKTLSIMKKYRSDYIGHKLNIEHYRQLDSSSLYKLKENITGYDVMVEESNSIEEIDIGYNFHKIFIPLISMYV